MSLADDVVQATTEIVDDAKQQITFLATITSSTPLEAKVDGSGVAIPCIRTDGTEMTIGKQVVLIKVGPKYYVVGALGTYVAPEIPDVPESKVFSSVLTINTNYGTTATAIVTVSALDVGTYSFRGHLGWSIVGATDQFVTVSFTGTTSVSKYDVMRYTASSNGGTFDTTIGTEVELSQTTPQALEVAGGFVVTVPGDLVMSMRRTAGTSGTAKVGANLVVTKV